MKSKLVMISVLISLMIILGACSTDDAGLDTGIIDNDASQIENVERQIMSYKAEIEKLKDEKQDLQRELSNFKKQQEKFPLLSNLSLEFVRAHTTGNKKVLRSMLSDKFELKEINDKLYATYVYDGQNIEWLLYNPASEYKYQDMVIQGYGYDEKEGIMRIHIREFYQDSNDEPASPPTFLNLSFQYMDATWKIVGLEFDV